jgi:hypothetical protein
MSTKLDSHLRRTSGPQDPVAPDPPCLSLESSLRRDPLSEGLQRPEAGNSRWNTIAPLISFVFFDLARNLLVMGAHKGPGICKIFGAQRWICLQKFSFARSKTSCLLKQPHGNPRSHNAWLAPAHISPTFNARKSVPDIPRGPLQQLGLFSAGQFAEQLFRLFQNAHVGCQSAALWVRMQADLS